MHRGPGGVRAGAAREGPGRGGGFPPLTRRGGASGRGEGEDVAAPFPAPCREGFILVRGADKAGDSDGCRNARCSAWGWGGSGPAAQQRGGTPGREDLSFDGVTSPWRGAQSGDAERSKTRKRTRIKTSRVKERGPLGVARAKMRTTTTRRQWKRIAVAMITIKR